MQQPAADDAPGGFIAGALGYFSSGRFHPMARPSYRVELVTVLFFSITLAVVDNAFVSVYVKQTFAEIAPDVLLNFVVALVGSASEIANILSFFWVSMSHGVRKVPFINGLQIAVVALVAALAVVPHSVGGLLVFASLIMLARVAWSGIILLRPTVWRANYRKDRASVVGRFSSIQQFLVATVGMVLGFWLDRVPDLFETAAPAAAVLGLVGVLATRKLRIRRERALLADEQHPDRRRRVGRPWQGPAIVWRVLRQDRRFAQFMICMFVLGFGNIMVGPMLVIALRDQFGFGYFGSLLVTSAVPYFLMPLAVPLWARFLDRAHVVQFRSIHSWSFCGSALFFLLAVVLDAPALLFAGSILLAIGYGGGTIAWNLGHVDFSPPAETSQYMATHVTLNGVRGLLAPLLSVALYERLRAWDLAVSTSAAIVLLIAFVLSCAGGVGFILLQRSMAKAGPFKRRAA